MATACELICQKIHILSPYSNEEQFIKAGAGRSRRAASGSRERSLQRGPAAAQAPAPSAFRAPDRQPRRSPWLAPELRASPVAGESISFTVPRPRGHQTLLAVPSRCL